MIHLIPKSVSLELKTAKSTEITYPIKMICIECLEIANTTETFKSI